MRCSLGDVPWAPLYGSIKIPLWTRHADSDIQVFMMNTSHLRFAARPKNTGLQIHCGHTAGGYDARQAPALRLHFLVNYYDRWSGCRATGGPAAPRRDPRRAPPLDRELSAGYVISSPGRTSSALAPTAARGGPP